jgi:hypothetical protein
MITLIKPTKRTDGLSTLVDEFDKRADAAQAEHLRLQRPNPIQSAVEKGLRDAYARAAQDLRETIMTEALTSTNYFVIDEADVEVMSYLAESFFEAVDSARADGFEVLDYGNDSTNVWKHYVRVKGDRS